MSMSHSSARLPRLPLVRLAIGLTRLVLYNSQTKVANKEVRPVCMVKGTKQPGNTLYEVKRVDGIWVLIKLWPDRNVFEVVSSKVCE